MEKRVYLKILVVYDSVSLNKNTEKIAKVMSEVLKEKNFDVRCQYVGSVDQGTLNDYECILVGSPTMALSATQLIKQFLEGFNANEFNGKLAAAFDTRVQSRLSGQATKGIQERLEKLGFNIIASPLVAYVEGSTRKNDFMLKDGELEKAKKYSEDLTKVLQV